MRCLTCVMVLLAALTLTPVAPAAAAETGVVRIVQDTIPHSAHNFVFAGDLGRFTLDDDRESSTPRVRVATLDSADSPFVVRQVPNEARWPLVSLTCSDHESVIDMARHTATIHLKAGETISCVWVNHRV